MENNSQVQELEQPSDTDVGEILRRARLHYGKSLEEVERVLRIRKGQIDAIERGDISKLPGRAYALGFTRTYAEFLGLDGGRVVKLFKEQYIDPQPKEATSFPVPASESKVAPLWLVVVAILILVMLAAYWMGEMVIKLPDSITQVQSPPKNNVMAEPEPLESVTPPAQQQQNILPSKSAVLPPAPLSSSEAKPLPSASSGGHNGIILNINDNSWVEIKDAGGKLIVSNVLKKGDQYFVPDSPGLTMSLGNAGGVELVIQGKALKPLGKVGVVMRDIPLDLKHLNGLEFKEETPVSAEKIQQ